jgi:hypothetical protein
VTSKHYAKVIEDDGNNDEANEDGEETGEETAARGDDVDPDALEALTRTLYARLTSSRASTRGETGFAHAQARVQHLQDLDLATPAAHQPRQRRIKAFSFPSPTNVRSMKAPVTAPAPMSKLESAYAKLASNTFVSPNAYTPLSLSPSIYCISLPIPTSRASSPGIAINS